MRLKAISAHVCHGSSLSGSGFLAQRLGPGDFQPMCKASNEVSR